MYAIMQISDLHRSEASLLSNDELLSSLTASCGRFVEETPPIQPVDAIVVCGDLTHGLPINSTEYPEALDKQYADNHNHKPEASF
jgi:predicted MPP superfamily phosphohydrolase